MQTDVTDEAVVRRAVETTIQTMAPWHVLFNNAGGSSNADGKTEASLDEFWRDRSICLAPFCCRFAIPDHPGRRRASSQSSMVGIKGELNRDAYTAAKGGVIALTRSMAAEFVREKVRVNAIAPGAVKTERILAMIEANPAAKKAVEIQPLGLIEPMEIAQLAVFLASDESRSITGEVFPIRGGR